MRFRGGVMLAALLAASAAGAQTTSEGIQAVVRGDYADAARILRPLAEGTADPDPLAQFFMALLYQSGSGVAASPIRACGLYLKAGRPGNPLMNQALTLAAEIRAPSPIIDRLCSDAAAGIWREPQPVTFTLAADHQVIIDYAGITVAYKGVRQTKVMQWGGVDWVFLPTRLTQIEVPGAPARRHFVEFFVWIPYDAAGERTWALTWFVHEVVGGTTAGVPGDGTIATVTGAQPASSFPVDDVARFVTANETVQRVVIGPHARIISVPSPDVR